MLLAALLAACGGGGGNSEGGDRERGDRERISLPESFPPELPIPKNSEVRGAADSSSVQAVAAEERQALRDALEENEAAAILLVGGPAPKDITVVQTADRLGDFIDDYRKQVKGAGFDVEELSAVSVSVGGSSQGFGFRGHGTNGYATVFSDVVGVRVLIEYSRLRK